MCWSSEAYASVEEQHTTRAGIGMHLQKGDAVKRGATHNLDA